MNQTSPPVSSATTNENEKNPYTPSIITVATRDITPHDGLIAVFPTYNEQATLGSAILQARQFTDKIIVVDDCSTDKTPEIAKLTGAEVIRLHVHTGRAYAILLGLKSAYEAGCKGVICIGPDGYSHIHDIPKIAARTLNGNADLVIGSRYLECSNDFPTSQEIKRNLRRLPKTSDDKLPFTDPLSQVRSYSRRALESLDFKTDGYNIDADIINHIQSQGLIVEEVSLTNVPAKTSDPNWKNTIKVLAAMPAFNEEKFIAKTIVGTKKYVDKVLVIDDGSSDATRAIAESLGAIVVHHEKNAGYGAALQDIFQKARDLHVEALIILDADGQHNPEDVGKLLEALVTSEVDVIIGSRFLDGNQKHIPGYRKVGMKVLDGVTRVAGVDNISDSQSGFRAYSKRAIDIVNLTGEGMSAGSEILIQISDHNLKIGEIPIHVRYDIGDTSTINPVRHGFGVLSQLINLITYRRPLLAFGIPGILLIIITMFAEIWVLTELYTNREFHYVIALGSAFGLLLGLLLVTTAIILNSLVRIVNQAK